MKFEFNVEVPGWVSRGLLERAIGLAHQAMKELLEEKGSIDEGTASKVAEMVFSMYMRGYSDGSGETELKQPAEVAAKALAADLESSLDINGQTRLSLATMVRRASRLIETGSSTDSERPIAKA